MELTECRALMGHMEWAESVVWQSVLALPQEDARAQAGWRCMLLTEAELGAGNLRAAQETAPRGHRPV